jgi:hypothetical protein
MASPDRELLKYLLPVGLLDYFEITKVDLVNDVFSIYLSELNEIPKECINDKLTSKGFYDEIKVQDFPIRGKAAYLYIKRRRWHNETTGEVVHRNWELVAKGTRLTNDFAAFLKEIYGYQSGKL